MTKTVWPGPLFYPPIGKIAVTARGSRIAIWPNESDSAECFTGLLLLPDRSDAQLAVYDLSCLWDRNQIDHIEEPTEADLALSPFHSPTPSEIGWRQRQGGSEA